jgi:hypothetical protein
MKFAIILAFICGVLLLGGCADNSLVTDEEYREYKRPAAFSPDYSKTLPGY